jgi:3-methyladenine DNA glycosylase AlkD
MAVLSAAKISAAYPMFDCFTKHLVQDLLSRRVKEHEAWSTCDDLLESIVRYPLIAQEDIQLLVKAVSDEAVPWCSSVAVGYTPACPSIYID